MLLNTVRLMAIASLASVTMYGCSSGGSDGGGAGSGTGGSAGTGGEAKTETSAPVKISIIKPLYPGQIYHPDSELEKVVEKSANVELSYETPPSPEYKTKLSVKLSGGDLPDIINTFSPNDPEHNALIEQGVFMPLDDLLPKFPKLKSAFSEQTWSYMKSPKDGKIYGVPWLRDRGGFGLIIRKDWLDKLGLKEPTTLDELVSVLKAFRDNDPDGNGQKDTIPLTFKDNQVSNFNAFFTLFGVQPGWHPSPGDANTLQYGLIGDGAKEGIKYLRTIRQEGLLDPDLLVGKTLGMDKFKSGKVGVLVANVGDYRQFVVLNNLKAEVLDPITHNGNTWSLTLSSTPINRTNQISAKSKNAEAALRYLEYQISDGFDYIQYGVEGKTYKIENGLKIPFDNDKKDPQYNTSIGLELLQPEWLYSDPEKYTKLVSREAAEYILKKLDAYEKYIVYDYLRPNITIASLHEKSAQLRQIIEEGYTKILLDSKTDVDQTFADMVAKWKSGGGDQVTKDINTLQTDKSTPKYHYQKK